MICSISEDYTMKEGDFVKINYTGRLQDGRVFDTTSEEVAEEEGLEAQAEFEPKTIILGAGHVVDGLEEAILESEVGDENEVEISPEKGFGEYDEDKIQSFSKREFKNKYDEEPRKGKRINIDGQPGTIISTVGGRVRVDLNHPLAGEDLEYEYEVIEKIDGETEKIRSLISLYGQQINVESFEVDIEGDVAEIEVPLNASFNQSWIFSKRQIPEDIFQYTDIKKVRFVEEFEKPEEEETESREKEPEEIERAKEEVKEEVKEED